MSFLNSKNSKIFYKYVRSKISYELKVRSLKILNFWKTVCAVLRRLSEPLDQTILLLHYPSAAWNLLVFRLYHLLSPRGMIEATVISVFKKGNKHLVNNYRHVS